jgi:ABC-type Fe3+-hydroxamate transport system substrate-binding protein
MTVVDDLGRPVQLSEPAARVVCLVPSITETLFAFGAGDRVVGVTEFCIHPAEALRSKACIGGTKNFDAAAVIALRPDLVIANAEENRKHQVRHLEEAGLTVFVTFPKTVDGCVKMMNDIAALTGSEDGAQPILTAIASAREATRRADVSRTAVLCPIWKDPYMTINADTFVDSIIRESGGLNVFSGAGERYPVFTLAEAAQHRPEVILLPTEPYRFTDGDKSAFVALGPEVPAIAAGRIHVVEGELLSWYGPRVARALREISALLA